MIGNRFRIFSKFSISPNGLLYKLYRDNGEQRTPFVFSPNTRESRRSVRNIKRIRTF